MILFNEITIEGVALSMSLYGAVNGYKNFICLKYSEENKKIALERDQQRVQTMHQLTTERILGSSRKNCEETVNFGCS